MINTTFFYLQFSALVLVHIFLLLAIIAIFYFMSILGNINKKTEDFLEVSKRAVINFADAGDGLANILSPFFSRNRRGFFGFISQIFRK